MLKIVYKINDWKNEKHRCGNLQRMLCICPENLVIVIGLPFTTKCYLNNNNMHRFTTVATDHLAAT